MEIVLEYLPADLWPCPAGWTIVGRVGSQALAYDPERRPFLLGDGEPQPLSPDEVNSALVDAVAAAGNRWIFPELGDEEGLDPWSTRWVVVTGAAEPDHVIALEPQDAERAVASLQQHAAYLEALPDHPDPAEFIPAMLRGGGEGTDHGLGLPVRVFDLG